MLNKQQLLVRSNTGGEYPPSVLWLSVCAWGPGLQWARLRRRTGTRSWWSLMLGRELDFLKDVAGRPCWVGSGSCRAVLLPCEPRPWVCLQSSCCVVAGSAPVGEHTGTRLGRLWRHSLRQTIPRGPHGSGAVGNVLGVLFPHRPPLHCP